VSFLDIFRKPKREELAFPDNEAFRLAAMQANVQPNFCGVFSFVDAPQRRVINVTPEKPAPLQLEP
jgi:hypothetical protein